MMRRFLRRFALPRERRKARRYAHEHCLFWGKCPVCGEYFGAQEVQHLPLRSLYTETVGNVHHGKLVCPRESCRDTAAKSWDFSTTQPQKGGR